VELLVDTEHQLSRATTALAHREAARRAEEEARNAAMAKAFSQLNALSRWFARPLWGVFTSSGVPRGAGTSEGTDPAVEGLQLVVSRLRRSLGDHQIERIDTEGRAFDATTMHAIGTVAGSAYPAGHVAEQLSPAYLWQGRVLRFAEVRVAE
jgi:molecular chaperone GrpE